MLSISTITHSLN